MLSRGWQGWDTSRLSAIPFEKVRVAIEAFDRTLLGGLARLSSFVSRWAVDDRPGRRAVWVTKCLQLRTRSLYGRTRVGHPREWMLSRYYRTARKGLVQEFSLRLSGAGPGGWGI